MLHNNFLFKAKRKNWRNLPKEQWWIEGNYITDETEESDSPKAYIGYIFGVRDGVIEDFDIAEIERDTLCQIAYRIQLDDVLIWENDILQWKQYGNKYIGIVKFGIYMQDGSGGEYPSIPCCGFYIEVISVETIFGDSPCLLDYECCHSLQQIVTNKDLTDIRVVGNVFDNLQTQ